MPKDSMRIEWWDIEKIIPYENNPRHNDASVEKVANSLQEFGWKQSLVVDSDGVLIVGHTRLKAAQLLGMEKVPVLVASDLTPSQAQAYRIADNATSDGSTWDFELLASEIDGLQVDFDMEDFGVDMSKLDFDFNIEGGASKDIVEDEVPEDAPSVVQRGDVWQLGRHRLMCGDSTDAAAIDRLMDGAKADCVFTDPPYNVAVGSKNKILNKQDGGRRNETEIAGDKGMTDAEIGEQLWRPAFQNMADHAKDDCSIYVTMPQGGTHMMMMMMADACWQVKHELMWLKNQPTFSMGRLDYDYKHEPIMYGWKKTHNFYGKGKFTKSVWEIDKPRESKLHPTMKPIELVANALENSTKENDCVLDVFGGSGSTLIACEQLSRTCYMMELDPHYCDVIIERWQNLTGETAQKVVDGGQAD